MKQGSLSTLSPPTQRNSADRIRHRFLSKIGIEHHQHQQRHPQHPPVHHQQQQQHCPPPAPPRPLGRPPFPLGPPAGTHLPSQPVLPRGLPLPCGAMPPASAAEAEAAANAAVAAMEAQELSTEQLPKPPAPIVTSCLGEVAPSFEPLKVCLDDDSSIEADDEDENFGSLDDDSYFLGDCEDMAVEYFRCPPSSKRPRLVDAPVLTPMEESIEGDKGRPPTPPPGVLSVSDDSSAGGTSRSSSSSDFSYVSCTSSRSILKARSNLGSLGRSPPASLSSSTLSTSASSTSSKRPFPSLKSRSKRRRVTLRPDVSVVPIPSRSEYTVHARERLWSSAAELYRNAARNAVEFASEGWNWRNATEDEGMLVHTVSGELVHPVHVRNVLQMQEQQRQQDGGRGQQPPVPLPLLPNVRAGAAPLPVPQAVEAALGSISSNP